MKRLMPTCLLSHDNKKFKSCERHGYLVYGLYMSPYKEAGKYTQNMNFCPYSTKECREYCYSNKGNMRMSEQHKRKRIMNSVIYVSSKRAFLDYIIRDLEIIKENAKNKKLIPAVRFSVTCDFAIEYAFPQVIRKFSDITFYDYTCNSHRFERNRVSNYTNLFLCFSYKKIIGVNKKWSDKANVNERKALSLLDQGHRIAIIFKNKKPKEIFGREVVDGDVTGKYSDLFFLHKPGVIIGLKYK